MQQDTADRSLRIWQSTGISLADLLPCCCDDDQKLSTTLIWFLFSRLYIQDLALNLQIRLCQVSHDYSKLPSNVLTTNHIASFPKHPQSYSY